MKSSFSRRLLGSVLAGALSLGMGGATFSPGCSTPSVPLPPPDIYTAALRFSSPVAGQVVLTGAAHDSHADAEFFIVDKTTGDGVITTALADGSFMTTPFGGNAGDLVQIYYEAPVTQEHSTTICTNIVLGEPIVTITCTAPD